MSNSEKPQVFISYAHEDLEEVRGLCSDLKEYGVNVWFDRENIAPGKWKTQIEKAILKSRYFLFCISIAALKKMKEGSGFVDDELQVAYEIAMAQDDRYFTILPVRFEDCGHGDHRLSIFHQYDLFENRKDQVEKLAMYLGGEVPSLSIQKEKLSEEEMLIAGLRGKAEAFAYAEEYEKALDIYIVLLSLNPNDHAWNNRGTMLSALGRKEEALAAFEKALEINPGLASAWAGIGAQLSQLGKYEDALQAFEEALLLNFDHGYVWEKKGIALYNLGKYEDALQAFEEALLLNPNAVESWVGKAAVLNMLDRFDEALGAFGKALEINPNHANAWVGKSTVLIKLGYKYYLKHDAAVKVTDIEPQDGRAWISWYEEALQAIEEALLLNPNDANEWLKKYVALAMLGRHEDAGHALEEARAQLPEK